jgi:hypothetical protein
MHPTPQRSSCEQQPHPRHPDPGRRPQPAESPGRRQGAAGRTVYSVFDLKDSSYLPLLGERFFNNLRAAVEVTPVMNFDDLRTGLDRLKQR